MTHMAQELKLRWQVLQEFTALIYHHDPMGTSSPNENEYEGEALSILARFTECGLHTVDDPVELIAISAGIVSDSFRFWFEELGEDIDLENLTKELLAVYVTSYPSEIEPTPDDDALRTSRG